MGHIRLEGFQCDLCKYKHIGVLPTDWVKFFPLANTEEAIVCGTCLKAIKILTRKGAKDGEEKECSVSVG